MTKDRKVKACMYSPLHGIGACVRRIWNASPLIKGTYDDELRKYRNMTMAQRTALTR